MICFYYYFIGRGCGATPLHRACYKGNIESSRLLIDAGAHLNVADRSMGDNRTRNHS